MTADDYDEIKELVEGKDESGLHRIILALVKVNQKLNDENVYLKYGMQNRGNSQAQTMDTGSMSCRIGQDLCSSDNIGKAVFQ